VPLYSRPSWRDEEDNRTITGHFRKGFSEQNYYIELEISGLRWNVEPQPEHMVMLDKRVRATGLRAGYKRLRLSMMTLAE
jgi:hypothetical protein